MSEALSGVLDAALKKRGFATRDILLRWPDIAPKPYDSVAVPDQLKWPRGAGHEGATLYLRCSQGHALALSHEGPQIAAAVNRYFGYFLVRDVKMSIEPFRPASTKPKAPAGPPPEATRAAGAAVAEIGDPGLRAALQGLGAEIMARRHR